MSMENVKKFMELVQTEEGLAKRMAALKDGLQEGEFHFKNDKEFVKKEILPLAKEYGLEFSVEDFMDFTSSQLTSLSEEDLADVSGGFPGLGLLIGLSVFLGGAATPTIASKAVSYFTGGGTSVTQSVSTTDVNKASESESDTEQTEDSQKQREIDKNFKNFVSQKKKELKTKLNDGTYLSPAARKDKINDIVNSLGGRTPDGQTITAVYNEVNDDITFKSDKKSQTETYYDKIRTPLYKAQSTNLAQQYDEAYGSGAAQLTPQYDDLSHQLQQKQTSLDQYASIDQYQQSINIGYQTINNFISQLKPHVNGTLDMNTDFNALKESFKMLGSKWNYDTYHYTFATQIYWIDQIIAQKTAIATDQERIKKRNELTEEINKINLQMDELHRQEATEKLHKQATFSEKMKTEFDYFYGGLVKALKEDEEISELAKEATTAEAKVTLAKKIKEKADQLVQEQFSKQLLDGCSLVVEQQGDSIGMKIFYGDYWFCQNSFSVDEFISTENHLEIINSEASKKRDEVAKKLAEYMQKQYTQIDNKDDLKRTIQSVLTNLKEGKLNGLNLGMQIVNSDANQVTFSSASGGQQRNTLLTIGRIADEYNKMVNMQALETTRQKNEGTIEYTPFGRKIWNSIGSQAQHVLNTIAQIEQATGNLSGVKDREAFENDLNYVANRILTQGNTPYGLKGDHRTDTSIKAKDLQKIQEFAAKIKK